MKVPRVLVIGSINMDLVSYSDRIPSLGETILGNRFAMVPGGKGANQALAAARLGASVSMLGAAGKDSYGEQLLQHLNNNGVDISRVKRADTSTGVALINVDARGNNQIVVIPGANNELAPEDLLQNREIFEACDVVVLQMEIPMATIGQAIELASGYGKLVVLNPAPAHEIPEAWLSKIDYLVPNEHEADLLGHVKDDFYFSIRRHLKKSLVITQGAKGVSFSEGKTIVFIPALKVQAVDTTAAGDAFIGGFSVALAEDRSMEEAIKFASAAAAISVTREGAQTSLPYRKEVEEFSGG
ncbi:ribokinase [Desulforamulus aquiferis]|uniref:Ribokinase n=1 Tax=Desulforamulus aquiferis TaxID=1397668 RepID=A0AAW7Z931_9FIRM|nr:ribokinase [Desulforamulus aquiferis]MDO7786050.1 ribokinase [Desulforamulus aquiferis]